MNEVKWNDCLKWNELFFKAFMCRILKLLTSLSKQGTLYLQLHLQIIRTELCYCIVKRGGCACLVLQWNREDGSVNVDISWQFTSVIPALRAWPALFKPEGRQLTNTSSSWLLYWHSAFCLLSLHILFFFLLRLLFWPFRLYLTVKAAERQEQQGREREGKTCSKGRRVGTEPGLLR